MNIAIVAATWTELDKLKGIAKLDGHHIQHHCHGVGLLSSTYNMTEICHSKPDLIIQTGIAGTYSSELNIGATVFVISECLGDEGAEDLDQILTLEELGFRTENEMPFAKGELRNPHVDFYPKGIPHVSGLTVNLSSGKTETIQNRKLKFKADIESMEGASLHYVCLQKTIPFVQIRSISNVVEPRCKENWNIALALENNFQYLMTYLKNLTYHED